MSGNNFNIHSMDSANKASVGTINFATGTTVAGTAQTSSKKNVHGALNAVSWGVLMPMGIMIASDSTGIEYSKHRNIGIILFCFATFRSLNFAFIFVT
ncbi:hypothetical protein GH714_030933 [Hevea brasiliensis]|uniref:Cytochrome b561 domain-containing protein n=1 Tax=Hevea brasiliensis TaxID=3981 RepID=A0A6A6KBG8_HEVBR|nr:hypothetical protein GH714_030933 [Hevea brasiliensis]